LNDERPNPDMLLERVTSEERTRGRCKIYLGMAAGVGKTYAMLSDALTEMRRGLDVVAGYIEPHGRHDTEALASLLEQIAPCVVQHQGLKLREFDLDAALKRAPQILLIDELAHSNAPGMRHAKRWQDIEECLAQGITVYTTLNVQHIASLNDVVSKITGIPVHETVPDIVVRRADEIELIDTTPEELVQRLKEGKVYVQEKVETALAHFFKPGNLLALRELVLRVTAERVDEQLTTFRRQHEVRELWPAKPRVLVCVSPNFLVERVVRTAWRLASSMHTELVALTVETSLRGEIADDSLRQTDQGIELARSLGAQVVRRTSDDVVQTILSVAREQNATMIVMGKPVRSRLREYLFGSIVDELIRASGDLDVYVITDRSKESHVPLRLTSSVSSSHGVASALGITAVCTGVCALAERVVALSNLAMFYLLAVAWAGSRLGRLESVITAVLSVLAFNFFFVPPRWTLAVADVQYLITFLVMLIIGLLISTLTLRLKTQAELVARRERRTSALYEVSKALAIATSALQIAEVVRERCRELFESEGVLFVPKKDGELAALVSSESGFERQANEVAVARWVSEYKSAAGSGTSTLSGAKATYLPISTDQESACVLAIFRPVRSWAHDNELLLDAFSSQIGSALERVRAESEATKIAIEVEREKVRNLLLSSVSHDFRTPLAAIAGAADNIEQRFAPPSNEGRELLRSIRREADALNRLVRNVLDLTRLESGELRLKLEWESVEELIGSALERTAALLKPREVSVTLGPALPLLRVDAALMVQVFVNLFENVAKHTPANCMLTISAETNESALVVRLRDNGPGLPQGAEQRVFEKSFRGSHDSHGFGLGLTICRTILAAHGGSIRAANYPTGGANFEVCLPLPKEQPEFSHEC
jgi:two-component system sensor histidine kinase KdpD